ncbi:unnamed protein product, partial [Ectocarpus sp. 4 AP-2014]
GAVQLWRDSVAAVARPVARTRVFLRKLGCCLPHRCLCCSCQWCCCEPVLSLLTSHHEIVVCLASETQLLCKCAPVKFAHSARKDDWLWAVRSAAIGGPKRAKNIFSEGH